VKLAPKVRLLPVAERSRPRPRPCRSGCARRIGKLPLYGVMETLASAWAMVTAAVPLSSR